MFRSKKPLRRIEVVDTKQVPDFAGKNVGKDKNNTEEEEKKKVNKEKKVDKLEKVDKFEKMKDVKKVEKEASIPLAAAPQASRRIKIEEVDSSSNLKDASSPLRENRVAEKDQREEDKEEMEAVGVSKSRGLGRRMEEELMAASPRGPERGIPPLPTSFAQFTKDWRTLHAADQRYEHLL